MTEKPFPDPEQIQTWIFDLDNTLYPPSLDIFPRIRERMNLWIQDRMGLSPGEACRLRRELFLRHGTTMRGLTTEYSVDPESFMDYVHDVSLDCLERNERIDRALGRLPGRKLVFTNASRKHAGRILGRLGIGRHFLDVFDIGMADWNPKPSPCAYDRLCRHYGIEPGRAVMVEDLACNLEPAARLGMRTVWLPCESGDGVVPDHVDHVIDCLESWLDGLVDPGAGGPPDD